MNKNIILPILSGSALLIKKFTGYEASSEEIDVFADMILAVITLYGVFMDPNKKVQ